VTAGSDAPPLDATHDASTHAEVPDAAATDPAADAAPAHATRRRGEVLERAIFAATLEQLATAGLARLTMEGVAEAAGTGKAALYRRWSDKEDLVFAALASCLPDPASIPERGDLRGDLLAILGFYAQLYTMASGAAFRVVKESALTERGRLQAMVRANVTGPAQARLRAALERAVQRGEARPLPAVDQTAAIGPALMSHYCMTEAPAVPDGYVEHLVDQVLLPLLRP
jgi:AcrR family transcriptional regulator